MPGPEAATQQIPETNNSYFTSLRQLIGRTGLCLALGIGSSVAPEIFSPTEHAAVAVSAPQAEVGMPFDGRWAYPINVDPPYTDKNSSHPSVHDTPAGGDWSTDLYATAGKEVKLRVNSPGNLRFSWSSAGGSCGESRRVNVIVDNTQIGTLYLTHLNSAASTANAPTNNMTIGKVANLSCNPGGSYGKHIHMEFKNTINHSCYIDHGNPGTDVGEGDAIGVLGSSNTGVRQKCTSTSGGLIGGDITPPVPWAFETLEGDPNSVSGHNADTGRSPAAVEFNGALHTFSFDESNGDLRHVWAVPGGAWGSEILDGAGGPNGRLDGIVGRSPEAIVYNNQLHLVYYDQSRGDFRHAWYDTASWYFETLDGSLGSVSHYDSNLGQDPSLAVFGNSLQATYYDSVTNNLRHAWYQPGSIWRFENLDGDFGSIAGYDADVGSSSKLVTYGSSLHALYRDSTRANLRHGWTDASGWRFENLDGDLGSIAHHDAELGENPAALVYNGTLQVFYYDKSYGNLRHAWADGTGWRFENLDGDAGSISRKEGNTGLMPTAVDLNGTLQLFYYSASGGNLEHAFANAAGWTFETLDGTGGNPPGRLDANVGLDPKALAYGREVQLFYYDLTHGNFRHARSL
jgi:hypothetical protein